ncbi:MAG TPA: glucose-6-phosphate isomerase [Burkholderiales bacterium]|nr:glucose-6-phosphate isomerase [Burkholderiales bacterium]
MSALTESPAWRALAAHRRKMASASLRDLFAADPERARRCSLDFGEILLDYSKHLADEETLRLLVALAEQADVRGWTRRMFAGDPINASEGRAVLHVALRSDASVFPEGRDVMPLVRAARERMRRFVEDAHRGALTGASGERITDVVNIGIGGSDLGPRMATRALRRHRAPGSPRLHFVANIDPADLDAALEGLAPATTLFVVASKTFTTAETLDNAARARRWLESRLGTGAALGRHFAAVTANEAGAASLGVAPERVFPMWDWVGGRYSVWSAVGLPLALSIGMDRFDEMLEGARDMDAHFRTAPLERNMPVLLALLEIWYVDFFGAQSRVVLPYGEDLRDFPAYLQQLEMESNGKRVDRAGRPVDYATAPVVWGASGTPSQHSFHQMLHQGTALVPADFIVFADRRGGASHAALVANALAQSAALMEGDRTEDPQRALPGDRPSSVIVLERLAPEALGQLIALYEHKVFVEGVIWNINSFDQWGVEMGKRVARTLLPRLLEGGDAAGLDASTRALLARLRGR